MLRRNHIVDHIREYYSQNSQYSLSKHNKQSKSNQKEPKKHIRHNTKAQKQNKTIVKLIGTQREIEKRKKYEDE